MEKSRVSGVTEVYVLTLYRRGEFDKARKIMARDNDVGPMYVCLVLCEFPDSADDILERYRKEAANPATPKWALLTNQLVLLVLGQPEKSRETCLAFRKEGITSPIKDAEMQRALKYLCGELLMEDYLKAAGESRVDRINVHFFVGLTNLARGNRTAAREHFRKAVETGAFFFDHYELWSGDCRTRAARSASSPRKISRRHMAGSPGRERRAETPVQPTGNFTGEAR